MRAFAGIPFVSNCMDSWPRRLWHTSINDRFIYTVLLLDFVSGTHETNPIVRKASFYVRWVCIGCGRHGVMLEDSGQAFMLSSITVASWAESRWTPRLLMVVLALTPAVLLRTLKAQTTPAQEISSHDVEPTFKLRSERNLVMVRVVVHDAKGGVVENLRKEDFQLFDRGKIVRAEIGDDVAEAVDLENLALPCPRAGLAGILEASKPRQVQIQTSTAQKAIHA